MTRYEDALAGDLDGIGELVNASEHPGTPIDAEENVLPHKGGSGGMQGPEGCHAGPDAGGRTKHGSFSENPNRDEVLDVRSAK